MKHISVVLTASAFNNDWAIGGEESVFWKSDTVSYIIIPPGVLIHLSQICDDEAGKGFEIIFERQ